MDMSTRIFYVMADMLMLVTLHFCFATTWNYLELRAQLRWITPGISVVCVPSSARFLGSQRQSGYYFQFRVFSLMFPVPSSTTTCLNKHRRPDPLKSWWSHFSKVRKDGEKMIRYMTCFTKVTFTYFILSVSEVKERQILLLINIPHNIIY